MDDSRWWNSPPRVRVLPRGGLIGVTLLAAAWLAGLPAPAAVADEPASAAGTGLPLPDRHPLDPLTAAEIETAASALAASGKVPPQALFPTIVLHEPAKDAVRRFVPGSPIRREAFAIVFDWQANRTYEAVVELANRRVVSWAEMPGVQPPLLPSERALVPQLVRADPRWQAAMRRRGIADWASVAVSASAPGDPPGPVPPGTRLYRSMSFLQAGARNVLARPIEGVVAVTDMNRRQVVEVLDTGVVPIATATADLDPVSIGIQRAAPKPLDVIQPDGPSFELRGHEIAWQGWRFRFAMQPREGVVLHTVGYEEQGRVRSILHRASVSEIVIPYGDPTGEWAWHAPFDAGEYGGTGHRAYSLVAGLHVPRHAVLLDAVFAGDTGAPATLPKAVALYERDGGLLWTHYDGRTSDARRARELVLGWIANFGNYDYAFNWVFRQDATLELQVELTGVLLPKGVAQASCADPGTEARPSACRYGTLVARNIVGPNHQHFVNVRLDLDVEGPVNRVVELNTRALPAGPQNPYGNAFVMEETVLPTELAARRDVAGHRMWKVVNPAVRGGLGQPVGYTLVPGENAHPHLAAGAPARGRAGFVDHHLWVTRYRPAEMDAAGRYPNQGRAGEGLPRFAADDEPIANADVVVWYTFGITHVPRVEDWPVMPVHRAGFSLVPDGFFARNPGLDVPPPPVSAR